MLRDRGAFAIRMVAKDKTAMRRFYLYGVYRLDDDIACNAIT